MATVRLHLAGGHVFALCKCVECGDVHKLPVAQAMAGPVACRKCGRLMDIKGAVIEAVERMDEGGAGKPDQ